MMVVLSRRWIKGAGPGAVEAGETLSALNLNFSYKQERMSWGFPSGSVIKTPPANARDTVSTPVPGRSYMLPSHYTRAPQLLRLRSTVQEPQLPRPHATTAEARVPSSPCSATREATAMRSLRTKERSPCSPQQEKSPQSSEEPAQPNNK